ncbi:hypothetical protein [Roseateles sp. LKC17W]|uniref:Uncharacterized protein n=1 Tax=Pelomonas margarita TaxID=3299031 RepID=A0ABW7FFM2_9BURK
MPPDQQHAAPEGLPADLAAIAAAADAEIAGQAAALPGAAPAEPPPDQGAELAAMLQMGVAMASPALPFLPACYTPEVCGQIGTAFAAVAEKHGWNLSAVKSPELALAVVTIPPTVAAVGMGRAHFAELRARREAAERAARAAPAPQALPGPNFADDRPHAGQRLQPQQ